MVNPFLEFKTSVGQYDAALAIYSVVVFFGFILQEQYTHTHDDIFGPRVKDSSDHDECPILYGPDTVDCFSMAAAWSFGEEKKVAQPKICFVPNRAASGRNQSLLYVYPVMWMYVQLFVSTIATFLFSWYAYRRLVAGTSESIATRLRIIVVNFRLVEDEE